MTSEENALHPYNTIRQILQKRQRVRKMEQQARSQGVWGGHSTNPESQSMRFKLLIKLKLMFKDKEDVYKKISYVGCFNNK
jgi:hypothetical protein